MRVMVLVKASKDSEAGVMPTQQLLGEMGQFNEELVRLFQVELPRHAKAIIEDDLDHHE